MCLHSKDCGEAEEKLFKAPEKVIGGGPRDSSASVLGTSVVAVLAFGLFGVLMASL